MTFKPYVPGQPITEQPDPPADPPPLSPIEPGYPVTIAWADGSEECYYNRAMLAYAIHTRALLKTCLDLGGQVSDKPGPVERLF